MFHRHRISAVITLVIYFLSTSLVAGQGAEESSSSSSSGSNSDEGGTPLAAYYNSSTAATSSDHQPPMEMLMKLGSAATVEEFLKLIDTSSIDAKDNLVNRRVMGLERSAVIEPERAACIPQPEVIKLPHDGDNLTAVYFPSCTRVNRCGGCCGSRLLNCEPTATETLTFQIVKSEYNSAKARFVYANKELVLVEQHTKCGCVCKEKKEDCNRYQEYFPKQCKCQCQNTEEFDKCNNIPEPESDKWLWDDKACQCVCRERTCTSGTSLDPNTCECKRDTILNFYSGITSTSGVNSGRPTNNNQKPTSVEDRKKFIIKAIPLPSADTTKYHTSN